MRLVSQSLFDAGVVNPQELVRCRGHVNVVGLVLGAFFDDKSVNRFVGRSALDVCTKHLDQRSSEVC